MATIEFNNEKSINARLSPESSINAKVKNLNYIPDYKKYEEERQNNELERETYINELKQRVLNGEFNGPQGLPGKDGIPGRGITNITKIKSEGLIDTYQIDYSDDTNTMISIKNGKDGDQEIFIGDESLFDKESTQVILIEPNKKTTSDTVINDSVNDTVDVTVYGKSTQAISTNPVSPSPDYPSEIELVKGKNLFNPATVEMNKSLTVVGDTATNEGCVTSDYIEVKENTDYYLSNVKGSYYANTYCLYDSSKGFIKLGSITGKEKVSGKITIPKNTKYIRVVSGIDYYNECQVEKGSSATRYVPYGNIQIVESGKNKWNNNLVTNVVTKNTDGFTITNIWANGVLENQNVLKTFKPNTKYTIKIKRKILDKPTTIGSNTTYDLVLYKPGAWYPLDDYKKYETNVGDVITTYRTITTPADLSDYRVLCYSFFGNNNGSTNYRGLGSVEIQEIMVVEGSYTAETFPQYEAYQGTSVDINLNGNVLTEYDKLIIKDGRAIIQKKSRNLSLAIADMANGEDYPGWRNVTYLGEDYPNKNTHMREFCNYKCNIAEFSKGGVGINSVYGNSTLFLSKGMFDLTQSQWKEQYPDLVFNLIYELAEPYEIDLGEITTLKTLNGTTYITNSEDAEMQITYTSDKLPKVKYKNDVGNLLDLVPNKISELDNDSFKALSNTEIEALINKQV